MTAISEADVVNLRSTTFPRGIYNTNESKSDVQDAIYGNVTLYEDFVKDTTDVQNNLHNFATAFGIVLHRYTKNENLSFFLIEPDCENAENVPKLKIITMCFSSEGLSFDDVRQLVQNNSKSISFKDLERFTTKELGGICNFLVTPLLHNSTFQKLFHVSLEVGAYLLRTSFNCSKLSESTMNRFTAHVANVCRNGITFPNESAEKLEMLSKHEENQLVFGFNGIYDTEGEEFERDLYQVFHKNLAENPHKLALVQQIKHGEIRLTYKELYQKVADLAHTILTLEEKNLNLPRIHPESENLLSEAEKFPSGIIQDSKQFVATLLPIGLSVAVASLSTLMLGKTVAPLHSSYASLQVESCLKKLDWPILVTTKEKLAEIGLQYNKILLVDEQGNADRLESTKSIEDFEAANLNETPYCLFTSGSTGEPKAVLVRGIAILNEVHFVKNHILNSKNSNQFMWIVPPGFIPSLSDFYTAWLVGGTLHIPAEETRRDLKTLRKFIYKNKISYFVCSTVMIDDLLNVNAEEKIYLSKLKVVSTMGAKLHEVDLSLKNFDVRYVYGSTETAAICTNYLKNGGKYENPSTGHPMPNVNVFVLDGFQRPVPIGVTGDTYVGGSALMAGYFKHGESGLMYNPFEPGQHMFRTGDTGYWSEGGELYVLGRKDQQIKIHGMRLELEEVESAILNFPGIVQTIVQVREFGNTKQLIAYCRPSKPENCPTEAEVKTFLSHRLQHYAIPAEIKFVSVFAKTHSGKIDRNGSMHLLHAPPLEVSKWSKLLKARYIQDRIKMSRVLKAFALPEGSKSSKIWNDNDIQHNDELESKVSDTISQMIQDWASILGIPEEVINQNSDFFTLGGNSIQASKLTQVLREKFPTLEISQIYKFPIISDFIGSLGTSLEQVRIKFDSEMKLEFDRDSIPSTIRKSLLTGATGYFGPAMLLEILSSTEQNVVCIVRAQNNEEAKARLQESISKRGFTSVFENSEKSRLQILAGDLNLPLFGLEELAYNDLSQSVDAVYHAAAEVNHMKTYEQLKLTTVTMVKNVIEFAVAGKLKWIHLVSSVSVFDGILKFGNEEYIVEEEFLVDTDPEDMLNGYAQSKWVSEELVRRALGAGVPGAIYRMGEIGSHSVLPIVNKEDALASFVFSCEKLGSFPNVPGTMPYVRLDMAAQFLLKKSQELLTSMEPRKFVYHIIDAEISLAELFASDQLRKLESVTLNLWELEFNSQCRQHTVEELGTIVFLNRLNSMLGTDDCKDELQKCNISFAFQPLTQESVFKSDIISNYINNLFK